MPHSLGLRRARHGPHPISQLKKSAAQVALESVPNARITLESGFTTVRDVIGPRMFVAGAYITITGGAGAMTGFAPDIQLPWDLHYGEANSPAHTAEGIKNAIRARVASVEHRALIDDESIALAKERGTSGHGHLR